MGKEPHEFFIYLFLMGKEPHEFLLTNRYKCRYVSASYNKPGECYESFTKPYHRELGGERQISRKEI